MKGTKSRRPLPGIEVMVGRNVRSRPTGSRMKIFMLANSVTLSLRDLRLKKGERMNAYGIYVQKNSYGWNITKRGRILRIKKQMEDVKQY